MSRRDGAIVAWHEVPGTAPTHKSRPVGDGVTLAGMRADSTIGVTKILNALAVSCDHHTPYPAQRLFPGTLSEALRAQIGVVPKVRAHRHFATDLARTFFNIVQRPIENPRILQLLNSRNS